MKYIDILFGAYLPDFGGLPVPESPGYLVDAVGIRATPNGYRGMPLFVDITAAAAASSATDYGSGACFFTVGQTAYDGGTGQTYFAPGDVYFYFVNAAGDISMSDDEGASWTDRTPNSGATLDPFGDFIHHGDYVAYFCGSRVPIVQSLLGITDFGDLSALSSGTPPISSCAARVRQHVVVANETTLRTAAIGTIDDWPTPGTADARSKQSIEEPLNEEFGTARRILGGEKIGIVVQDKALTRMTYTGRAGVYEFDTYETMGGNGFGRYSRFATDGKLWYWYNDFGFFATDGYGVQDLSRGKVAESIFNDLISHPNGGVPTAQTIAYDPKRSLVIMGSRQNDEDQLCYSTKDGSFSFMRDANAMALIQGYSQDANGAQITYNINSTNRELQRLDGNGSVLRMQTGFIEIVPNHRIQLHGAEILGTGTDDLTLQYKGVSDYDSLNTLQTGFTSLTASSRDTKKTGRFDARFFAFRITGTGAESQLIRGIRVFYEPSSPI